MPFLAKVFFYIIFISIWPFYHINIKLVGFI